MSSRGQGPVLKVHQGCERLQWPTGSGSGCVETGGPVSLGWEGRTSLLGLKEPRSPRHPTTETLVLGVQGELCLVTLDLVIGSPSGRCGGVSFNVGCVNSMLSEGLGCLRD